MHVHKPQLPNVTKKGGSHDPQPNREPQEVINLQAYTVEQVAEILQIGRDKVYHLLRTDQLRSIKIGKLRRITSQHLADFIARLENETL